MQKSLHTHTHTHTLIQGMWLPRVRQSDDESGENVRCWALCVKCISFFLTKYFFKVLLFQLFRWLLLLWCHNVILKISASSFFFLYSVSIFRLCRKLRSELSSQTYPGLKKKKKTPLKAGTKTSSRLFLFFLFSLYVYPPTFPRCHVVMPTSSLNQETGNDCTPAAPSHMQRAHTHTHTHTHTQMHTLSKHPHPSTHSLEHKNKCSYVHTNKCILRHAMNYFMNI